MSTVISATSAELEWRTAVGVHTMRLQCHAAAEACVLTTHEQYRFSPGCKHSRGPAMFDMLLAVLEESDYKSHSCVHCLQGL